MRYHTPLLVVYALINRETMLDLQPGRSVVERFLQAGIDLYMIDWGYPSRNDRFLGFDDHINGYMDNVVEVIRQRTGCPQVNLMGICMGGTFSVIYAALHPEKIRNLVTTVTPTNFDTDKGLLHVWMKHMDVDRMVDIYGKFDHLVPPEACDKLTGRVGSRDTEDICLDTGHIGIYVSSRCQREFAPRIAAWLKARDLPQARKAATALDANTAAFQKR